MTDRPKPLVALAMPCSLRLFREGIEAAQRSWREDGHHRWTMTTAYMREEGALGLRWLVIYDQPVTGELPTEVLRMIPETDPAGQQTDLFDKISLDQLAETG